MLRRSGLHNWIAVAALVAVSSATAQGEDVLRRVLANMAPTSNDIAIRAAIVRTYFDWHEGDGSALRDNLTPTHTAISDIVTTNGNVKESVVDTRTVMAGTQMKERVLHYARNGEIVRTVVPTKKGYRVIQRRSTDSRLNYFQSVLSPVLTDIEAPSLGRSPSKLSERLELALVLEQQLDAEGEEKLLLIEGEYPGGSPERFFRMVVLPTKGYAVKELIEYDDSRRELSHMRAQSISRHMLGLQEVWYASTAILLQYRYDDEQRQNSRRIRVDIANMTDVPVNERTFDLPIPPGARVFDATLRSYLCVEEESAEEVTLQTLASTFEGPGFPDAQALVEQTRAAIENDVRTSDGDLSASGTLQLPAMRAPEHEWLVMCLGVCAVTLPAVVLSIILLIGRTKNTTCRTVQADYRK